MSEAATSFINSLKDRLPKWGSIALSAAFFGATLIVNVTANKTHIADVQAQQDKRITNLEEAVKNDLATRREVDDVKTDVREIKGMLLEELKHHGLR